MIVLDAVVAAWRATPGCADVADDVAEHGADYLRAVLRTYDTLADVHPRAPYVLVAAPAVAVSRRYLASLPMLPPAADASEHDAFVATLLDASDPAVTLGALPWEYAHVPARCDVMLPPVAEVAS